MALTQSHSCYWLGVDWPENRPAGILHIALRANQDLPRDSKRRPQWHDLHCPQGVWGGPWRHLSAETAILLVQVFFSSGHVLFLTLRC